MSKIVFDNTQKEYKQIAKDMICGLELSPKLQRGSNHSNQERLSAVCLYFVVGRLKEVSKLIGIAESTIRGWRTTEWWAESLNKVRAQNADHFEARSNSIIDLAFENMEDRLRNGEYAAYDNKTQKIIYKPVSTKDAATVTGIMFDKNQIMRSLPTTISHTTNTHLLAIQNTFNAMADGRMIEGECVVEKPADS